MFTLIKKLISDERGMLVPMSVAILPIVLLFLAFSLDFGRAFLLKHQLQGAADAAALAGTSETEAHLVFGSGGVIVGTKPVINRSLADQEAHAVFNANIELTNLTDQGVTILDTDMHAIDDTHYYVEVLADIETYISGPVIAMWSNDPGLRKTRVKRIAVAKVKF